MASFAAQAALRSKWSSLVEEHSIEVPPEVSSKVTSVVGWLKQASLEVRAAGRRAVSSLAGGGTMSPQSTLVVLHFNDVYNVESRPSPEPIGGAARFCTAIKSFSHLQPLILFSGDAFSPSMLSTFTKGEQMVPVLNDIGTHCAVLGNHDFDHGLEVLSQWVSQSNFPWLMSNVVDNETGRPLGEGRITRVLDWAGRRIGLIGLVEKEWLDTLATINPEEVTFLDFIETAKKLGGQLKQEGCDYVIALTHMRTPNDIKLAEQCDEIDLILGGHDHVYEIQQVNNKHIIKSGTDFRQFSKITINFEKPLPEVSVEEINVTASFAEDKALKEKLDKYTSVVEGKMDEVLGCFSVPLDGRFTSIRTSESNLGNWVCDVVLSATGADLVVVNSGTFRSDQVHPAGDFTMRDLVNVIPMRDPLVVLSVTGEQVLKTIENGVSMYPKLEGRFPQVAGISFAFDPRKPPGQRVDAQLVRIGDEYLVKDQTYRLATKSYMHSGCDGYVVLKDCPILTDEDECPELGLAVQNHFYAINVRLGKTKKHSKHRQSLVTLSRRHSLVKMLDVNELDGPPPLRRASTVDSSSSISSVTGSNTGVSSPRTSVVSQTSINRRTPTDITSTSPPMSGGMTGGHRLTRRASLDDLEQQSCQLTPRTDQRIIIINNEEKRQELFLQRQRLEADSVIHEVEDECSPQESTSPNRNE